MLNKEETRKLILEVINEVEPIITASMGALGLNACIINEFGLPSVVDDGITIAKGIEYEDPYKQAILDLLIQSSEETNKAVGDASTLSFLIPCQMTRLALESKTHPVILRKQLKEVSEDVISQIEEMSVKISEGQKKQIATISSKSDKIGQIVSDAMDKVGDSGFVTIAEGKGFGLSIEHIKGMQFDKGFLSHRFDTGEFIIENARVLVVDQKIDDLLAVKHLLNAKNLLIICNGVDDMTLATMLQNNAKKTKLLAVQAPEFGGNRTEVLKDIASYTGTKLAGDGTGLRLDEMTLEDLGTAEKVTATMDKTSILGGEGDTRDRVKEIKRQLEDALGYDKHKLEERLAKLTKGIAKIRVGGATKTRIEEDMHSVEDAVNATKSAIEGGIVKGGGLALYEVKLGTSEAEEIMTKTISKPFETILKNAGVTKTVTGGYNVLTNKHVDMIAEGIIDPALAPIHAIRNGTAVTGTFISMNSMSLKLDK